MLAYIPYMDPMGMGLYGIIIFYTADYHHDSMTMDYYMEHYGTDDTWDSTKPTKRNPC